MAKEEMTLNDARKKVRQVTRFVRMFQDIEEVLDVAISSEDQAKMADLHVKNARNEIGALRDRTVEIEQQNVALLAVQEDMQRQGQFLSEKFSAYEKSVEVRMAALDSEYEERAERLDERYEVLQVQKDELEQQVAALATEKAHIEGVVEAFRKANAGSEA